MPAYLAMIALIVVGMNIVLGQPLFPLPLELGRLELPVGILLCGLAPTIPFLFRRSRS